MSRRYRVAVAGGAGDWGRHYLRELARRRDCEIVALVDTARERRSVFAERYGVRVVYDRVEDLLVRDVPDIVCTILPVSAAYDAVIACAEAGVKVVCCEKPISASLAKADRMVAVCRERGTSFGCGGALWEIPYLRRIGEWTQAGNIGRLESASLPTGLSEQVSGAGCVILNFLRFLTGREVEWVEGWTPTEEAARSDEDCNAFGRLGLGDGLVCEVPASDRLVHPHCVVSLRGSDGHVWLCRQRSILVQGRGADAAPVFPDFYPAVIDAVATDGFRLRIDSLVEACAGRREALCSGHDSRQVLEIAAALKLSARAGHRRVTLPLEDREQVVLPIPYRWLGGDVTGWEVIGRRGQPEVVD